MSKLVPKWFWYVAVIWVVVRSGLFLQLLASQENLFKLARLGALLLDVALVVGFVMVGARVYLRARVKRAGSNGMIRRYHEFEPILVTMPSGDPHKPVAARPCPNCGTNIDASDRVCFYCHTPSEPWYRQQGVWWQHTERGDVWLDENTGQWRHPEQV